MPEKRMTWSEFLSRWMLMIEGVSNDFMNVLVNTCPVDTGNLKQQLDVRIGPNGEGIISMPEYGYYIEFGTAPHIIRPKNKKALFWKGADHPVKVVRHPGTRPQPFIRNAIATQLKGIIIDNLKRQYT